jgi:hypothetical protein
MKYNPPVTETPVDSLTARSPASVRWTGLLAAILALVSCVTLGVRQFAAADVGYHLYYGREFIETGRIVTTNHGDIYRLPPTDRPIEDRPEPGPGAWYDGNGVYRFINANWGTQAIIGAVWWLGGEDGVQWLRIAWTAVLFACLLSSMRRSRVPWAVAGAGILLAVAGGYTQMHVRGGMLGVTVLAAQLVVLLPLTDPARRVRWPDAALLSALQVLFVNIHSYFLLGIALAGTVLVDRALRWTWLRLTRGETRRVRHARRNVLLAAAAVGAMTLACFVNPWTWRLAAMPVETLLYMREHGITGGEAGDLAGHPWARIGELHSPWDALGTRDTLSAGAVIVLLVLAAASLATVLVHRRWSLGLMVGGIAMVMMSVRRNITPGALLLAPLVTLSLWLTVGRLAGRLGRTARLLAGWITAGAVIIAAVGLFTAAVTQRLFTSERSCERIGWGWNGMAAPVSAGRWINGHDPNGRLWSDFNSSSNLLWLTGRSTPGLTNTWAYPPALMDEGFDFLFGVSSYRSFLDMRERRGVEIVVLHVQHASAELSRNLTDDPNWAVVDVSPRHVTWLWREGANAELAAVSVMARETVDVEALVAKLAAADPVKHMGIYQGGIVLYHIGWYAPAAEVIGASLSIAPDYHRAWLMRGKCLALAGTRRMLHGDPDGRQGLIDARECFQHALVLQGGDYPEASENLGYVNRQLDALEQGKILYPKELLTPPGR